MTRLLQLDVPEEHWKVFVDVVQNWFDFPWENLELVLNNVMTPDLTKIKCYYLGDLLLNINRQTTFLKYCRPDEQLWFEFHFSFIFYFEWCCEWISCAIFKITRHISCQWKNVFHSLKSVRHETSKILQSFQQFNGIFRGQFSNIYFDCSFILEIILQLAMDWCQSCY